MFSYSTGHRKNNVRIISPVKTPVLVFCNSVLSRSDFEEASFTYSSTSCLFSFDTIASSIGCSGATTIYVAPNRVSGLVVYTSSLVPSSTVAPSPGCNSNDICAPYCCRQIQLLQRSLSENMTPVTYALIPHKSQG